MLVRYNPNRISSQMNREFERVLGSMYNKSAQQANDCNCFSPRVDIIENDQLVTIILEAPGMEKEAIKIVVDNNVLTLSGERKLHTDIENENILRSEILSGEFNRSFTLPDYIDQEKIKADYKNGLLIVSLPKTEAAKPKEIEVDVN